MAQEKDRSGMHRSTFRVGLKLLTAIIGIELIIMFVLGLLGLDSGPVWAGIADALLLGLCSSILISVWVVRPLQQAKQKNDLYNAVVNSLSTGVVVTDYTNDDHAIVSVNPAFSRITGYTLEEVKGRHPQLLQGDDVDDAALEETRAAMRQNKPVRVLQRNRRKDGTPFWNDLYLSPIADSQGEAVQWVGLVHDVTEQKELEAYANKLAHVVEQADEAICTFDLDGRIDFCNPAFCRHAGLDAGRMKDRCVWDFWSQDDPNTAHAQGVVRQQGGWEGRHKCQRADGTIYDALTSLSPVRDEAGTLLRYSSLHRDISDMTAMEEELLHAQRMEAVGTLAGGIAHDFNNVLAAILGNLFLMKNDLTDHPKMVDRINRIEDQGYQAADMIRQLLTFARKDEIIKKSFDMKPFAKELGKFIEPAVPENIRLIFEVADESMLVEGDPGQIQQGILNLITNARHAIEDKFKHEEEVASGGGCIKVTVRNGKPAKSCAGECRKCKDTTLPKECIEIRVEDNGVGMSEETRKRIFEPYFTTKGVGQGTGLGLPMVFGCMEMHQGCIQVESTPGQGSAFSLYFPRLLQQDDAIIEDDREEVLIQGHGEHVLIADDNEAMRETLKEMLTEVGYQVLTAVDGEDAINVFSEYQQDIRLVFLDKVMPGHNGMLVARHIKAESPDTEVVLMTGYAFSDVILDDPLILNGSVHMMRKPWMIKDINDHLRRIPTPDATAKSSDEACR